MNAAGESRPARARGLKPEPIDGTATESPSRPARARGLKQDGSLYQHITRRSRPARARGLKHVGSYTKQDLEGRAPRGRVD